VIQFYPIHSTSFHQFFSPNNDDDDDDDMQSGSLKDNHIHCIQL